MSNVLILDGMNLLNRANVQFGKPKAKQPSWDLSNDNQDVSSVAALAGSNRATDNRIVYTALRMLRSIIEQFEAEKVFFCLEGTNNFRYKLYPEYKANRIIKTSSSSEQTQEQTEKLAKKLANKADFERQRDIIIGLLKHLPIVCVHSDGFEADDVIATLVSNMPDEDITMWSGDSDLIQLLQKGHKSIKLFDPRTKEYVGAPEYSYLHWKCLRGDKGTDNIPGLAGPKKTEKLLSNPDLLKAFMASEENAANYRLNKELIELRIIPDELLLFADYNVDYEALKEELIALELSVVDEPYWSRFVATFEALE